MADDQSGKASRRDYTESTTKHIIEEDGGILGNGYSFGRGDFQNAVGREVGVEILQGRHRRGSRDAES